MRVSAFVVVVLKSYLFPMLMPSGGGGGGKTPTPHPSPHHLTTWRHGSSKANVK